MELPASVGREQRQKGRLGGGLGLGSGWGKGRVSLPSPAGPHVHIWVERTEPVGESGLINPSLSQAFSRSRRATKGQAAPSFPYQWKGLLPRGPLLSLCTTPSSQSKAGAGEDPCGPGSICTLNGFPRECLSKLLILIKTNHEWQGAAGGRGPWLHHTFRGGDHHSSAPCPLHCCFLTR